MMFFFSSRRRHSSLRRDWGSDVCSSDLNGWKTASRQPVKNQELWQELHELNQRHTITWIWVKGHNGHPENERCDQLANEAIAEL